jgi:DnaD/phage-associated family protein
MSEERSEYKIEGRPSTIFRTVKCSDNPYVMVDMRPILNEKLSWKAKGILVYLLSRPDGWEVNLVDLTNRSADGLASVKSGCKELKEAGHLKHAGIRKASGQFDTVIWEVYETPQVGNQLTDEPHMGVSPEVDFPSPEVEKPHVEKPHADNRTQVLSTLSNKEISSSTATDSSKESTQNVFKVYQNNIAMLTPLTADALEDDEKTYGPDWVCSAIQEAALSEVHSLKYVEAILKRWKRDGYKSTKTKQEAQAWTGRTLN